MTDKRHCIRCDSPDLVPYWHKAEASTGGNSILMVEVLYRHYYANAERCVDCGHVMPNGGRVFRSLPEQAHELMREILLDRDDTQHPSGAGRGTP